MDNEMMMSKLNNALNFYKTIEAKISKDMNNNKHLGLGTKNATHYYKQLIKYTKTLKPAIIDDVYNYDMLMSNLELVDAGIIKFNKNGKAYVSVYTGDDNNFLCYGDLHEIINNIEDTVFQNTLDYEIANKKVSQNA